MRVGCPAFPARATSAVTGSTSTPSSPASTRAYSGRSDWSRMLATIGAAARMAWIRPSAVSRS